MTLCDDGHDEVCYDGRYCPACLMREEKDQEITSLKDQIEQLEKDVASE